MYHPNYKGPTVAAIAQGQAINYDLIFRPPENEEWIIAHSDRQQKEEAPKSDSKKKNKKSYSQIDKNLFGIHNKNPFDIDNNDHKRRTRTHKQRKCGGRFEQEQLTMSTNGNKGS